MGQAVADLISALSRIPDSDLLRQERAIQLLDRIGTDDAKRLLSILADGAAESPQTVDAIAAVRRLKNRSLRR